MEVKFDRLSSELVAAAERCWASIQSQHPEVPDAVVLLGSGVERGRLVKLGHWWGGRWEAKGETRGEVLLAGEALHLPVKDVFQVLLHEAAHGLNAARGVKDTSRGGSVPQRQVQGRSGGGRTRGRGDATSRVGKDLADGCGR